MPNKGLFFILLGAWLILFQFLGNSTFGYGSGASLFGYMYDSYGGASTGFMESDDGYAVLIPFVVLGLFWIKRDELMSQELREWWPGLVLVGLALVLHLLGYMVQQPRVSIVGLFVGIYGLTGLAWGYGWLRASFFPFCLFAFCVPLGTLAEPITFRLRLLVCQLVEWICHNLLSIFIVREGTMILDPTGQYHYEVAAACSGIRSLIATVAFAVILAFVGFRTWYKRLVVLGSAFPLAVLGNLARMMLIVIAAEFGGQEAGNYVHEGGPFGLFSLLPYVPAFVGLLVLERYWGDPRPRPDQVPAQAPTAARAPEKAPSRANL